MTALSNSLVLSPVVAVGSSLRSLDQGFTKLSFGHSHASNVQLRTSKRTLSIHARYSEGKSADGVAFIGGFLLGGIIAGLLGCVYAPQISKALLLAGGGRNKLLKEQPDFIYNEGKASEKKLRKPAQKIE